MTIVKNIKRSLLMVALLSAGTHATFAGNDLRAGQAGASEILINPWAATAGWGLASTAGVTGLQAGYSNVAGLPRISGKGAFGVGYTNWLADANVANAGVVFKTGEDAAMGLSVTSVNFGELIRTTVETPEGLSTFDYSTTVVGYQYGKNFTDNISGGIGVKLITQGLADLNATGFAFDLGVQYFRGDNDELKFGISFQNIGGKMKFSGSGDDVRLSTTSVEGEPFVHAYDQRLAGFELPTRMIMSASYDFLLDGTNRITPAFAFASNAFTKDQISLGVEYGYTEKFVLHAGYDYQGGIFDEVSGQGRTTALTGFSAGFGVNMPYGTNADESKKNINLSYSFRTSNPFGSLHGFSLSLDL
jgi:hypothetical protein